MSHYDYGWAPYVPVAERRAKAEKAIAKAKKAGSAMAPIAAYRGALAKTFWGKAWSDNLENYSDYANRLPRGRTYVRNGSVIDLHIAPGEVRAQVMGSALYTVSASVTAVPAEKWKAICTECASSIDSLVELLQGKLSSAVMARICQSGTGLFPAPREIKFKCSCPDGASMCKHVAAVLYGVGKRLDDQPELLFQLRQVEVKDLVAQAAAGLTPAPQGKGSRRVLDSAALGDVFGLEMAETAPPRPVSASVPAAAAPATAKKVARKTSQPSPAPQMPQAPGAGAVASPQAPVPVKPAAAKKTAPRKTAAKNTPKTAPRTATATSAASATTSASRKTAAAPKKSATAGTAPKTRRPATKVAKA